MEILFLTDGIDIVEKILSKFRSYELLRSNSLIFVKRFDKVTFVIKTAGDGSLFDGNIFR